MVFLYFSNWYTDETIEENYWWCAGGWSPVAYVQDGWFVQGLVVVIAEGHIYLFFDIKDHCGLISFNFNSELTFYVVYKGDEDF